MTCQDCPNQTDGKCCHQLIRPQGSKTMNVLDIQAWERELNHAAKMQEQREKITFSGGKTYELPVKEAANEKRA
ncbi:hypothetical protein [Psychrobacter sp. JB193]|uniref:hypothetical protein n=1 Tax=Psychrobacter sp. JB193 TaxID=2024406 RepID=UPI000BAAC418|nr:hypothetical protein [Psychrobacter sp. JB193]PAT63960.1 hypothetical protein CIK80_02280 [Psychrobacter sp. JB193]